MMQKYNYLKNSSIRIHKKASQTICFLLFLLFIHLLPFSGCRTPQHEKVPSIAFLQGHGECSEAELAPLLDTLAHHFSIDMGSIGLHAEELNRYALVVIARPITPFNDTEKYILDQYLMQGGALLWLTEGCKIDFETLLHDTKSVGIPNDININDLLFSYGLRINPDLLQKRDFRSDDRIVSASPNDNPFLLHVTDNRKNRVSGLFFSSVDFVGKNRDVQKKVLLKTEKETLRKELPTWISFTGEQDRGVKSSGEFTVGASIKGKFDSHYKYGMIPENIKQSSPLTHSVATGEIAVISSGTIITDCNDKENLRFLSTLIYTMAR